MIPRNKALADLENNPSFQPQSWTKRLYDQLYDIRELSSPMEKAEVLYTLKHIGNPILNRSFVLTLVFGFCAALGIAGGICWYSEKWSRLGWLVPLLSLAASTPLLIASYRLQREVPDTSAHLQIIEALPGSRCIQGIEWTTTYKAGSDLAKLSADGDAITTWPQSSQQSDLRRLTWNDRNRWLLSSSAWPGGLWQLQTRFNVPPQRLDVNATLDRQGLSFSCTTPVILRFAAESKPERRFAFRTETQPWTSRGLEMRLSMTSRQGEMKSIANFLLEVPNSPIQVTQP